MNLNKLNKESLKEIIAELKEEEFDLGIAIDIKDGCMKVEPRNITNFKEMLVLLFHLVGYIKLSEKKMREKKDEKEREEKLNEIILNVVRVGLRTKSNESLVLNTAFLLIKTSKDE
ncbi:MAG: hypothetical protein ACTTKR_01030 [Dialister pneumosintes]